MKSLQAKHVVLVVFGLMLLYVLLTRERTLLDPNSFLRQRYAEVFGETTNAKNKAWLVKRIAWRLQALAEGDLSERARRRAAELANDADLRLSPPRPKAEPPPEAQVHIARLPAGREDRLPPPGPDPASVGIRCA